MSYWVGATIDDPSLYYGYGVYVLMSINCDYDFFFSFFALWTGKFLKIDRDFTFLVTEVFVRSKVNNINGIMDSCTFFHPHVDMLLSTC